MLSKVFPTLLKVLFTLHKDYLRLRKNISTLHKVYLRLHKDISALHKVFLKLRKEVGSTKIIVAILPVPFFRSACPFFLLNETRQLQI
ncbi:MAG TPA: hypothetical protein VK186_07330 [Candidatus Deferrimicrobium sp.]|nr:hypothetical protein [Candidatus Deferrimicrobium sp.]